MLSHQQLVEQDAEGVDVGGGGDDGAAQLLRSGIVRRQRPLPLGGDGGALGLVLEQLGDPEVEQLDHAVGADQDVARLDVAVHDQVAVGMRHRGQDVVEQREAPFDVEAALVAVAGDGLPGDEVEHQVRLPGRRHAGVDEARDVRVRQSRQDGAFALEPLAAGVAQHRPVQQLDGDEAADALVGAPRPPHAAAAALAEERLDHVAADHGALERRRLGGRQLGDDAQRRLVEEMPLVGRVPLLQEADQAVGEGGVFQPQRLDVLRAIGRLELEHFVEQRAQPLPHLLVDVGHGSPLQAAAGLGLGPRQRRRDRLRRGRRRRRR